MKNKAESKTELATPPSYYESENTGQARNGPAVPQKPPSKVHCVTVEPFLLCYILPLIISSFTVQQLNLEKACKVDLNYTEDLCEKIISGNSENFTDEANEVQILVAEMTSWSQPLSSFFPALVILFVGSWSDKTGDRKTLMLVPIIGEIISSLGLILSVYYFDESPLWATGLIESLPGAFCGGLSIALMGAYSYIADVTTIDSRTFRVGLVAVIVTLGVPLGSAISGILVGAVSYYTIFGINLALYVFGFLHTLLFINNVRNTKIRGSGFEKFIQFFNPLNVWDTISLVVKKEGRQRILVILVICAHCIIMGPVFGEAPVTFLYVLQKFSKTLSDYSFFSTYSVLMGLIGTAIAVLVFSKWMKMHDAWIGMIAATCKVLSSVEYALAPTWNWFYAGPAFDIFGNSGSTAIRALGTKVVKPDDVGKMCSLIGFVEALLPTIYTPIYSQVYARTLDKFPGAFYLLGGVMSVPAFFIFIALYKLHTKELREIDRKKTDIDLYTYENYVTAL